MGISHSTLSDNQDNSRPDRNIWHALKDGLKGKCPSCHQGSLFERFLRVSNNCTQCGEALHHHRADDAPPYFTIFIVAHIAMPLLLAVEVAYHPPIWVHTALWGPLIIVLCLLLLPRIKGALIAHQWALYMHGFDPNHNEETEFGAPRL